MASAAPKQVDAVELEIIRASLDGIVQEMQNSLFRTGYSTIVRESQEGGMLREASAQVVGDLLEFGDRDDVIVPTRSHDVVH